MGYIKEKYSNGRVGLVVAFRGDKNTDTYYGGNDLQEAINYFNLYLKDGSLYEQTKEEIAVQELAIQPEDATKFREQIDNLLSQMDDETAEQNIVLYPIWKENTFYKKNSRVRYGNSLYRVLLNHTSRSNWIPSITTSLFEKIETKNS